MSLGTARETVERVRCLAAYGFTISTIRCTSGAGRSIIIEELSARARPQPRPALSVPPAACVRPELQPATIEQLELYALPERPPVAGELVDAHCQPKRPPSAGSEANMALIKRHSIAGSCL